MTNSIQWTTQQARAIETLDRDVLVTASAGTGKTAVLAARCVKLLSDTDNRTDVSRILVLTFTDAAAQEMLSRIAAGLHKKLLNSPNSYLRHQLLLLDAASISTINAFCKRIVTENFHTLGIDPAFTIIDEDQQALLKSELLDEVIDLAWADPSIAPGLDELLKARSIQASPMRFLYNIVRANDFLGSVTDPQGWLDKSEHLSGPDTIAPDLAAAQKQIIGKKLTQCASRIRYAQRLDHDLANGHWAEQIEENYLQPLTLCIELLAAGDNRFVELIKAFRPPPFKTRPKDLPDDIVDTIKAPAKNAKKVIADLADLALCNADYEQIIAPLAGVQTKTFIELVARFNQRYKQAKDRLGCLDFADLEHLTLKLLSPTGTVAETLRKKFKYVFIDEYQDINNLQQAILDKISRPDNCFVVGDIKQSIYAFRNARPNIFLDRLRTAAKDKTESGSPLRIDLTDNFRSRAGVLDFANAVFNKIMTAETASVDYDENLFLKAGFEYDPDKKNAPVVELNIIDESPPDENTEDVSSLLTAAQKQAALIAERIKQFVGMDSGKPQFKIYDKQADTYRDVAYRDIVILLRSPVRTAADYIEMLRLAGIPVSSQSSTGYFASMEVTDIISLLRVLDNRRRDIELAAVLKSPLFAITDSHLAMIRTHCGENKKYDFYDCLLKYSQDGKDPALRKKLISILTQLDNWAATAKRGNFADLIWKVYRREGYLSFVTALPGGRQRRANLLKLHEWAIQFERFIETSQTVSLARFVEFVEKLFDQQRDFSPAASETSAENAVRIMSIHKSKGLEFPVVFLADLHRQFNLMDTRADCVMDDVFGLGLRVTGSHSKTKLKSIAHQMITDKKRDTILAEEMRLLYVAITRAREKLILTAAKTKTACASIAQTCKLADGQLQNWQLKSAKCFIDWILFALGDRPSLQNLFDSGSTAARTENDLFTTQLLPAYDLETLAGTILQAQPAGPVAHTAASDKEAEKLLSRVRSSLTWQYDFKEATTLQAKTSVSQVSHRDDEFSNPDLEDILQQKPKLKTKAAEKFDPAQIGSATHLLIKKLDLSKPVTAAAIRRTAKAICAEALIEKDLADRIDIKPIQNFFTTELGKTATQHQNTLHREWPFTYAIAANEIYPTESEETVIIQGIIDMIIETPRSIVIIDFKTDHVTASGVKERKKRYSEQMRLYARAAGAILKKPVTGSWLYFLNAEKFAKMEWPEQIDPLNKMKG